MSNVNKLIKSLKNKYVFCFPSRIFTNQMSDLTNRIDVMETSLKKDIRTILNILHQQQQMQFFLHQGVYTAGKFIWIHN